MTRTSARRPGTLLLVTVAIAVFAAVTFTAGLAGPLHPAVLSWLAAPPSVIAPALAAFRTSRMASAAAPTRRFWRHLTLCIGLVGLAATLNAYDGIGSGTPTQAMSAPTVVAYGGAITVLVWSLLRLPLRGAGSGERVKVALDGGTVLVAGAIFLWHFQALPMLTAHKFQPVTVVTCAFALVLELLALFAVAKVALAGQHFVTPAALRLFAVGLIAGISAGILQGLIADKPWLIMAQLAIPVVMICGTAAAEAQRRAVHRNEDRRSVAARPFSRMPYLAIVAVDALLLVCVRSHAPDASLAAVAAVALTGLVVGRQVLAFRENGRLMLQLDHGATHDSLTQLPNRALFTERLTAALAAGGPLGVALIDLDDFKTVNDTLGHGAGDTLLVAVARRLTAAVGPAGTVARLGGDEFVVILDGGAPASAIAERMIAALTEPVLADGHDLLVRASIGLARAEAGDAPEDLLRRADIAMYAAKSEGGSTFLDFVPSMAVAVADTAAIGAQLHHAITERQLFLEYQPIVDLKDRHLRGVEALVRWQHPSRGVVPPAEFIPAAERTGLIVPLGDWVLRAACSQLADWTAAHGALAPQMLNVNITAHQLSDHGFVDRVVATLAETGISPARLTLEITESTAVELGDSVTHLEVLRRMGVRIALDDFGTGRSTLTMLHELPVDQLKLDRSFTQDTGGRRATMPAAVIALAQAVDLDIVAEGIETEEQAQRLAALGYRYAQGFHFARPMPADEISRLIGQTAPV